MTAVDFQTCFLLAFSGRTHVFICVWDRNTPCIYLKDPWTSSLRFLAFLKHFSYDSGWFQSQISFGLSQDDPLYLSVPGTGTQYKTLGFPKDCTPSVWRSNIFKKAYGGPRPYMLFIYLQKTIGTPHEYSRSSSWNTSSLLKISSLRLLVFPKTVRLLN